ncbi:MAG: UDP-2,3-diacylglucosamine diphosphatase [Xanthomonadaceae bacterium]|nr:UDP-2,3-diacylglucosamine diphosphatase [Xanthomonadaceae bacterium]
MTTLFISDLHLDAERPDIAQLFGAFIDGEARDAEALYILGDLFEAWVGDDDPSEIGAFVAAKLRALSDTGVRVYFQHGNRDFLVSRDFAQRAGLRLLPEHAVIVLAGEPVLLMHGDSLCTDDLAYQAFRAQTRNAGWRTQFLSQPLAARLAFAAKAREASRERQQAMKTDDRAQFETITDVSPDTVRETLARYGIATLIHGHTHRPAVHTLEIDGRACRRVVLGDWYTQGSVLRVDSNGAMALSALSFQASP